MRAAVWADSASVIVGLAVFAAFIASYVAYGNRMRAPAGRALMVMSTGYAVLLVVLLLHHPLGIEALNNAADAWFQAAAVLMSVAGVTGMTALMIRANGRWPWQR